MMHSKICIGILAFCVLAGCSNGSVKDIDGNTYKTVKIGRQTWFAEDLKVTRLNDGTPIPHVKREDAWINRKDPAYCWYNNDSLNSGEYGALYNGYAVGTGKLCPKGWHVSTEEDWWILGTSLGSELLAGDRLKEAGTNHWKGTNAMATGETGFNALPGGFRSYNGSYTYIGKSGYWWTSTTPDQTRSQFFNIRYKTGELFELLGEQSNGFCVRCVMDEP
jgi:uncharacterized protein (TIGR02145 family)